MTDSMDNMKKLLSYKEKEVASVRLKFKQLKEQSQELETFLESDNTQKEKEIHNMCKIHEINEKNQHEILLQLDEVSKDIKRMNQEIEKLQIKEKTLGYELEASKRKISEVEELNNRLYNNLKATQKNLSFWQKKTLILEENNVILKKKIEDFIIESEIQNISLSEDDTSFFSEPNEVLARTCEETFIKNNDALKSLKELRAHILKEGKNVKEICEMVWKKYNENSQKHEVQEKIFSEKENELENKELTQSLIFNRNPLNYDFLSQSIAEYFPRIEKNANKSKMFNSSNAEKYQTNSIKKYYLILNSYEETPGSLLEKSPNNELVLKNEYLSEASKRGFNLRGLNFDGIYQFMKEFKLDFHKNNKRKELPSSKCYLINGTRKSGKKNLQLTILESLLNEIKRNLTETYQNYHFELKYESMESNLPKKIKPFTISFEYLHENQSIIFKKFDIIYNELKRNFVTPKKIDSQKNKTLIRYFKYEISKKSKNKIADKNERIYYLITTNKILNESSIKTKPRKELLNELIFLRNPTTLKEMQSMSLENLPIMDFELFISLNQTKENSKTCLDLFQLLNYFQGEKNEVVESKSLDNKSQKFNMKIYFHQIQKFLKSNSKVLDNKRIARDNFNFFDMNHSQLFKKSN